MYHYIPNNLVNWFIFTLSLSMNSLCVCVNEALSDSDSDLALESRSVVNQFVLFYSLSLMQA